MMLKFAPSLADSYLSSALLEQRKLSSYDTLASRRLLEEHRRQARYEQKATDDFVTSRVARQQSDKPL